MQSTVYVHLSKHDNASAIVFYVYKHLEILSLVVAS